MAPPWRWAQHALAWASLLLGAWGYGLAGINALLAPALVYLGFLVAFLVKRPGKVAP